ncbi:MAG: methionine--tRNA ligase [Mycoplasma sp.]
MSKTFYISTPIYYPSGKPHLGHAYSTILADALAKYKALIGYEVFFLTGTDEHGKKLETAAEKAGVPLMEYIDKNVEIFKDLWVKLGINYSSFIRTTDKKHEETIQKIFTTYLEKGLIYLDSWKGLYCVDCEENILTKDVRIIGEEKWCPIGHKLSEIEEPSYFFKMSQFNDWMIKTFNEKENWISPVSRINELKNNFLEGNLSDLSISRTSFNWGIKIRENPDHVIYVWMDALFNYISALNYLGEDDSLFQKFWNHDNAETVHLLSKEITRFHCVYWPIFLHSLNVKLPTKIISHGWIITKEGKMSKSLGNVIDPFEVSDVYSTDCLRYYLLKEMSLSNDNVFSIETMEGIYNGDLANNVGNLLSRTLGMLEKYSNCIVPKFIENDLDENDKQVLDEINQTNEIILKNISELDINSILNALQNLINVANKYIENEKPWVLFKENQTKKLFIILNILSNININIFYWLQPVTQDAVKNASKQLNFDFSKISYKDLGKMDLANDVKTDKKDAIFLRIEIKK